MMVGHCSSFSISKRIFYFRNVILILENLISGMPGDSKTACLHWGDVLDATHGHSGVGALFISLSETKNADLMLEGLRKPGIVAYCTQ